MKSSKETSSEARNYIESLLIEGHITVERYESLVTLIGLMDSDNCIVLGDGLKFKLLDENS